MSELLHQIRIIARALLRDRAFTGVAVALLAVGIAANVTIFAVIDAVLLRPLPFSDPDALVHIGEVTPQDLAFSVSEPNYIDFREGQRTFTEMAAIRQANLDLSGTGDPARLRGLAVTSSFFDVLGISAARGRTFTNARDQDVVVLSDRLWRGRFSGDPRVLGSTVTLSERDHIVIGIMPPEFVFGESELWVPFEPSLASDRGNHWLDLIGRLRSGVTHAEAQRDLAAVSAQIAGAHPEVAGWSVSVTPLDEWFVGSDTARGLWVLMVAVALLLLLACANVGSLFLARGSARQSELAIRTALGAARATLMRHLFVEAALIGVAGAAIGLLLSTWSLDLLRMLAADRIARLDVMNLNSRHVFFAFGLALVTSLLFGLAPAVRASLVDLQSLLRRAPRTASGARGRITRDVLVAAQVSLATVLLIGSGLLMRSFVQIRSGEIGLDTENLYAVPIELTSSRYGPDGTTSVFFQNLTERLRAIPGVAAAGAATTHPFVNWRLVNDVTPVDRAAETSPSGFLSADWRVVTTDYFDAAGVDLLEGRLFEVTDMYYNPRVAVVTRTFADRMWPGEAAVGEGFYWGGTSGDAISVIGVVEDVRDMELAAPAPPLMFLSTRQMSMPMMTMLVRTEGDVPGLADAIRREVWELDPAVPVPSVERVSANRSAAISTPRMYATLLAIFAVCALLVASIGVYALVAYHVTSRTRELGIRAALGARPFELLRLVLTRSTTLVAIGILSGITATFAFAGILRSLLYETAPRDPVSFIAVPALLAAVALLAAWLPARRTIRIDPVATLRAQ